LELDDVGGFGASAAGVEVLEVLSYRHLVVERGGILEREQPRFFDDGCKEDSQLTFDRADELLEVEFCSSRAFLFDADGIGGIEGNGGVKRGKRSFKVVEGVTVCGSIGGRIVDKAGEAVVVASDVDGLEQVCEELTDGF
jgi:hypothetical protein